jgi:hypothetical protein
MTRFQNTTTRPLPAALLVLAVTAGLPAQAAATILTFDQIRIGGQVVPTISGNEVEQDYGDRVSAGTMPVSGGTFTYGNGGEGFTPGILAEYFGGTASNGAPASALWQDGYGDLENVFFGDQRSQSLNIRLTGDAGVNVRLYGFDLAGWPTTDYVIAAVRVIGATQLLFEQTDVLVHGAPGGPGRTTFAFATPLEANALQIMIDYANLDGALQDNIGIDNIRFGQSGPDVDPDPSVPEPASAALCGSAFAAWLVRRSRRSGAGQRTTSGGPGESLP